MKTGSIWDSKFWCRLRLFSSDTKGATASFLAAGLISMVGTVGIATDTARAYLVKARLSQALDAAGLAGGRVIFSPTRDDEIKMYFHTNFPTDYLGATTGDPNIAVDANHEVITLSASATVPTTFMKVLGMNDVTVSSVAEITRETQILDVVLAVDMSGSMSWSAGGGQSRIQAARTAASELVNILFGQEAIKNLLKIGVVPWNSKVNASLNGTTFDPLLTTTQVVPVFNNPLTGAPQTTIWYAGNSLVPLLSAPAADWKGCVYSRYHDNVDPLDDADTQLGSVSWINGDWNAWEPIGPEGEPVSGGTCTGAVGGSECRPCLSQGITPIRNVKQEVLDAISELQSPTGSTNISQGLGWAWRVLTPGAPFTEADPNPPGDRQQAIVLLTDGENVGGSGDGYKAVFGTGSTAQSDMDSRLLELATNIKASGVVIYTIQFANSGSAMQTLLKSVATGPDSPYYHYAPDGAALQQVFQEVANHLSELRISK
ncbi:MAG: VWA domain-containing protein [Alphaproteobacteria bacterium]|nr:VWA domain-containing protein [Alphaproteobacteria bacterium]